MKDGSSVARVSPRQRVRTWTTRGLNLILYLAFCGMLGTGLMLVLRLPPGSRGGRGLEVLGWDRHAWGDFHFWLSVFTCALLVVHLAMHWTWLKKVAGSGRITRVFAGLILGLLIAGGLLLLPVTDTRGSGGKHRPAATVDPLPTLIPAANETPAAVEFRRDIQPILAENCVHCHGPKKAKAQFRADRPEEFFTESDAGALVVPGDVKASRLIGIVTGKIRLKKSEEDHLLGQKEVALLKAWIASGAPR